MAYVVVWTLQHEIDVYEDFYVVYGDEPYAQRAFRLLLNEDKVWCAAITKVVDATEPHWIEENLDDPSSDEDT